MITKLFEVRDEGTFIPVIATLMEIDTNERMHVSKREAWLLGRAGYALGKDLVLLATMDGGIATYDPYDWTGSRTMRHAHAYIEANFASLESGAVIDVEFILGKTTAPKQSEQPCSDPANYPVNDIRHAERHSFGPDAPRETAEP